jgi:hypothetical protein
VNLRAENTVAAIRWTKLPMHFDPAKLRADLEKIGEAEWRMHFNSADFDGEWSGAALRSRSGRVDDILPMGTAEEFVDTPLMERCLNLRSVVEAFAMPLKSVRLLRLHAGSQVKEHRDSDLGLTEGQVRIHVPVATHERVEFIVGGRQLRLREGEAWYIDFSQPHRIDNGGSEHRVHLILDGELNAWAKEMLDRASRDITTESFEPLGLAELRRFQEVVYNNESLRGHLMSFRDAEQLMEATVAAGRERGFRFKRADAASILARNRQEWTMRAAIL